MKLNKKNIRIISIISVIYIIIILSGIYIYQESNQQITEVNIKVDK